MGQKAPQNNIADPKSGNVTPEWLFWLQGLADAVSPPVPPPPLKPPTGSGGEGGDGGITIVNNYGSGTPNKIAKWLEPQLLGDSLILESGDVIVIAGDVIARSFATTPGGGSSGVAPHAITHKFGNSDVLALDDMRVTHNIYLKGRNATNTGDVDMFRVNASNEIDVGVKLWAAAITGQAIQGTSLISTNNIQAATGGYFYWNLRSNLLSPADGVVRMTNAADNAFGRLQLGGGTSSFPALKRNAAGLEARLADDSALTTFRANLDAGDLVSGALPDARLSANVPLKNTDNTFTGAQLVSASLPEVGFNETGAGTDLRRWRIFVFNEMLRFNVATDSLLVTTAILRLTRGGRLYLDGGQLTFPSTPIPSSDPNTLDDYKEGSWTPTDVSGAGLSLVSPSGTFTKIGRQVSVAFTLQYPITASGALASVGGLPYTNGSFQGGLTTIYTDYGAGLVTFIAAANTVLAFYTTAAVGLTNANLSGKIIRCVGMYFI